MTITFSNITKSYNDTVIVNNWGMTLVPGTIYGILGKNGTGKTTLLKLLSGLVSDDSNQRLSLFHEVYCPIGIHIEQPRLYPFLSGEHNLRIFTADLPESHCTLDDLTQALQLKPFLKKKVKTYSLGTKQKLSLVISMMMANRMLLLDEPTNGLDEDSVTALKSILLDITRQYGVIVIITTHDLAELHEVIDQPLKLSGGKLEPVTFTILEHEASVRGVSRE